MVLLWWDKQMLRVLNLGAGVQSTCLFLWAVDGQLDVDVAIFADTGDEPREVYEHLQRLKGMGGPEIVTVRVSDVSLGQQLIAGMETGRHVSIPTFLDGDATGVSRRQCTAEYKIKPIHQEVRRRCGLGKGERTPSPVATQIMGLSFDEPKRVANVRLAYQSIAWCKPEFPLFDEFVTRADCVEWLAKRLPGYVVPRSACVFCPYKTDAEWIRLRDGDPEGWRRAIEIDEAVRNPAAACNAHCRATQYLHRSRRPLAEIELVPETPDRQGRLGFSSMDCEGMCGV